MDLEKVLLTHSARKALTTLPYPITVTPTMKGLGPDLLVPARFRGNPLAILGSLVAFIVVLSKVAGVEEGVCWD
jgi:hypothetical protein